MAEHLRRRSNARVAQRHNLVRKYAALLYRAIRITHKATPVQGRPTERCTFTSEYVQARLNRQQAGIRAKRHIDRRYRLRIARFVIQCLTFPLCRAATEASASGPVAESVTPMKASLNSARNLDSTIRIENWDFISSDDIVLGCGLPRCDIRMTAAPWLISSRTVGRAASTRVQSATVLSSVIGTLKSTRTSTRFPARSAVSTDFEPRRSSAATDLASGILSFI